MTSSGAPSASPPPVVDCAWVRAHDPPPVLADVRWYLDGRSGRAAYEQGHLPGAVFVDLDTWLAAPPSPEGGRHPLPDPERFAEGMSRLGIGEEDVVIAYDDAGGLTAARLVWMLRVTGHRSALLDGGLRAWQGPLETADMHRPPAAFTPRPWPAARLAGIETASDPRNLVIDARAPARFRGEREPVDPRAGHIPGARNVPAEDSLGADGRLRPVAELRTRFAAAGVTPGVQAISMCGSGITACHNLMVMEHLGLAAGRLYAGSWSHYCADPRRPAALGEAPAPGAGT